jgi:hypothetical protein
MRYESHLIDVPQIQEALNEISDNGWRITSIVPLSESQQILIVIEKEERQIESEGTEDEDRED